MPEQKKRPKIFILLSVWLGLIFASTAWANTAAKVSDPQPEVRAPDIALIQKNGVLRVAFVNHDIPPFFMHDAQNNWTGIEVDLAQMIADRLKVKLVIVPTDTYNSIIDAVANGKADIGMGLVSITPERELRISFTDPYYIFQHQLLVNRLEAIQSGWNTGSEVIAGMQNTSKKIMVAALADSAQSTFLQNSFPNAQIVTYPTVTDAMQAVADGKVFAALSTSPEQINDFLQHNPKATLSTEAVVMPNSPNLIAAVLPWQYFYLRDWLNLYFDYLQKNGTETELFQKYGQTIEAKDEFSYPS